jgi:hypothetical protein
MGAAAGDNGRIRPDGNGLSVKKAAYDAQPSGSQPFRPRRRQQTAAVGQKTPLDGPAD